MIKVDSVPLTNHQLLQRSIQCWHHAEDYKVLVLSIDRHTECWHYTSMIWEVFYIYQLDCCATVLMV